MDDQELRIAELQEEVRQLQERVKNLRDALSIARDGLRWGCTDREPSAAIRIIDAELAKG